MKDKIKQLKNYLRDEFLPDDRKGRGKLRELSILCDDVCECLELCDKPFTLGLDEVKSTLLGTENIRKVVNAAAQSKYLETFSWQNAGIDDNIVKIVAEAFSSTTVRCKLKKISLANNNIGDSGAGALCAIMKAANSPRFIALDDNKIGDLGAEQIAYSLVRNECIHVLGLSNNSFGKAGHVFLISSLLTNHKCYIFIAIDDIVPMLKDWTVKELQMRYAKESKTFNPYHYTTRYLSSLNYEHRNTKTAHDIVGMKISLLTKNDFEARWLPVLLELKDDFIMELWADKLEDVDDDVMRQVIRKRNEIDLSADDNMSLHQDGTGIALQNQIKQRDEYGATLKKVKIEKEAAKDALAEAKEDVEDANELVQQQTLFTDKWQGKFDDLAELAEEAGVDIQKINEIRYRA